MLARNLIPISRSGLSCHLRRADSPTLRRVWWPKSSATNWGNASSLRTSRAPAGLRQPRSTIAGGADGYTLTLLTNSTAISVSLFKHLPYDPVKDFAPISAIGERVFVVGAFSPFHALDDMLKAAREKPGTLNVGTINVGGTEVSPRSCSDRGAAPCRHRPVSVDAGRNRACCATISGQHRFLSGADTNWRTAESARSRRQRRSASLRCRASDCAGVGFCRFRRRIVECTVSAGGHAGAIIDN